MSQNIAAYLAKVDYDVKTLLKAPALSVPKVMKLADFSKSVIADENMTEESNGGDFYLTINRGEGCQ